MCIERLRGFVSCVRGHVQREAALEFDCFENERCRKLYTVVCFRSRSGGAKFEFFDRNFGFVVCHNKLIIWVFI